MQPEQEQSSEPRRFGMASHPGGREYNEDCALVTDYSLHRVRRYLGLVAVADGMGGHQAGDVASRTAVDMLQASLNPSLFESSDDFRTRVVGTLQAAVAAINSRLYQAGQAAGAELGMGTTLTCAVADDENAYIAHVGDSRAYLFTSQGTRQVTEDHSVVGKMVAEGLLTEEQAQVHEQRNVITRAVGPSPEVEPDILRVPVRAGEILFLCSDGLYTVVTRDEIAHVLSTVPDVQQACEMLVQLAVARGTGDNATAVGWRMPQIASTAQQVAVSKRAKSKGRRFAWWKVALLVLLVVAVGLGVGWGVGSIWYSNKSEKKDVKQEDTKKLPPRPGYRSGDSVVVTSPPLSGSCYLYDYPDELQLDRLYDGWVLEVSSGPQSANGAWWYRVRVADPRFTGTVKSGYVDASFLQAAKEEGP